MSNDKTLVVVHSVTGNTDAAARAVAAAIGATVERIVPADGERHKPGLLGIVRGGFRALFKKVDPVRPPKHAPKNFGRLIVATPTWGGHVPPAVRGWFAAVDGMPERVALIVTAGGSGPKGPVADVTALARRAPDPVLHLTEKERRSGADKAKIDEFVERLV